MMANMTLLDTSELDTPATLREDKTPLIDDLSSGAKYAIAFGGQGGEWLSALSGIVRDFALERACLELVTRSNEHLARLRSDIAHIPHDFDVLSWVDSLAVGESAENLDGPALPSKEQLTMPVHSVPGIVLTQLLGLAALERQGLDVRRHRPVAILGHSQGTIACQAVQGVDPVELLTIARLIGLAAQQLGARKNLLGRTMISVSGVDPDRVAEIVAPSGAHLRLRNGRRSCVLSGRTHEIEHAIDLLTAVSEREKGQRQRKEVGGAAFGPVIEDVDASLAFHHPDLAKGSELVAEWAEKLGYNGSHAAELTRSAIVDSVDWVHTVNEAMDAGAEWVLDLGPSDLATRLSIAETRPRGVGLVATTTRKGHRALTTVGARPRRTTAWANFAPRAIFLPDGSQRVETAFTRLTGKSPVLLAGMTPTTVDAQIVAAAANAGFWAELAGGGQVSEPIFRDRVAELSELLEQGASFQFNALLLDPYLWKLHLGGNKLVQKARAAGAPLDAVVVTAGVPELEDALALAEELSQIGIAHLVFKPGTLAQIRQVIDIADHLGEKDASRKLIVQIEGGKAGGHHSWEDLDELLIASYPELRQRENIVVCVGGGIGTPDIAAEYLTGTWAYAHDYPLMPLDGVLVGTAAMAALEATTSPQVKDLLVATPGSKQWVGAGKASNLMASGRSQLGADLHEIDNTFSRTGRLLDEVAGDGEAVEARREEIIEALNRTAKPWFGDLSTMTYGEMLARFLELSGLDIDGNAMWLDDSWLDRFHALVQRAEARLDPAERGLIDSHYPQAINVHNGPLVMAQLRQRFTDLDDVALHPADRAFFLEVCRRPGKPVNFVPVIDADVRRWWRSDSLWQAHDDRYDADTVCVIPGIASVAGITRANEPVAELLQRFEDACLDAVLAAGGIARRVSARRRIDNTQNAIAAVLGAPDVVWAGRTVPNPLRKLGGTWILLEENQLEHASTGATLTPTVSGARCVIGLDEDREVSIDFTVTDKTAHGHAPLVTSDDAVATTRSILRGAVAQKLPTVAEGVAKSSRIWPGHLPADHAAVSGGALNGEPVIVPDVYLGLAWPHVFALLSDAVSADGTPVVEGMLELVHLDHQVRLLGPIPGEGEELEVTARLLSITDTTAGRVITCEARIGQHAVMSERLLIIGRVGDAELSDPAVAAGTGVDAENTPRRTLFAQATVAPQDMHSFAAVTGDHNPIHTSTPAAQLAGLGAPIVHGMWTSAHAQYLLSQNSKRHVSAWTARFLAPVALGSELEVKAVRIGYVPESEHNQSAGAELHEVSVLADGVLAMTATARLEAPRTAYAFPGQGIQKQGMGMDGYQRCVAAREIWDRADPHTRNA